MDAAYVSAFAALAGATVGGLTYFAAIVTKRYSALSSSLRMDRAGSDRLDDLSIR
jgi:hypothetical protein